ncbi:MAG: response regulator [Anaerolineae bacterium]|nr:response regulator [Anaerolineae bacterium]
MASILIVDDEPNMLRLFTGLIDRMGCETAQALSGAEAIEILDQHTPDLLILDLAMPEISGTDVLRYVRGVPRLDAMKVMILTARPNVLAEVNDLGFDYWITKPILPQDFLDAVEEALNGLGPG